MLIGQAINDVVGGDATANNLAKIAEKMKDETEFEAIKRLNGIKDEYGVGVSALVRIYNASGGNLTLKREKTWNGHISKYTHDETIGNGQWSVFLHGCSFGGDVTNGIVYHATSVNEDIYLGWDVPHWGTNTVYVESRENGHYDDDKIWEIVKRLTVKGKEEKSADTWSGLSILGTVTQDSSPVYCFTINKAKL